MKKIETLCLSLALLLVRPGPGCTGALTLLVLLVGLGHAVLVGLHSMRTWSNSCKLNGHCLRLLHEYVTGAIILCTASHLAAASLAAFSILRHGFRPFARTALARSFLCYTHVSAYVLCRLWRGIEGPATRRGAVLSCACWASALIIFTDYCLHRALQ